MNIILSVKLFTLVIFVTNPANGNLPVICGVFFFLFVQIGD